MSEKGIVNSIIGSKGKRCLTYTYIHSVNLFHTNSTKLQILHESIAI